MNEFDLDEYCSDLSSWVNKQYEQMEREIKETDQMIEETDQDSKSKEQENEELLKKINQNESKIKKNIAKRGELKNKQICIKTLSAEKKKERINKSVDYLVEMPNIFGRLIELVRNKKKVVTCPTCNQESARESVLVSTKNSKQFKCIKCNDNEGDCSEELEKALKEVKLLETIKEKIESAVLTS